MKSTKHLNMKKIDLFQELQLVQKNTTHTISTLSTFTQGVGLWRVLETTPKQEKMFDDLLNTNIEPKYDAFYSNNKVSIHTLSLELFY